MRKVVKNSLVAKKFAEARQESATNPKRTFHFSDHSTLYSYRMPIAWRNQHNVFVVRSDSPSVTTSQHITDARSAARNDRKCKRSVINVDMELLGEFGFDHNDVVGDRDVSGTRHIYLKKDGQEYTLTSLVYAENNELFMVRNLPEEHILFAGFVKASLTEILLDAIPEEYEMAARDGWVVWVGPFFLVPQPSLEIPDPDSMGESTLPRYWSVHERAGKYVRGILRYRGSIVFSMNVDFRFSAMDTWMEVVPCSSWIDEDATLGDPAKIAIYTDLPRKVLD